MTRKISKENYILGIILGFLYAFLVMATTNWNMGYGIITFWLVRLGYAYLVVHG